MRIFFVCKDTSWLTRLFTGSTCYHIGFLDDINNIAYDMYWLRRKRRWPRYQESRVYFVDCPVNISREYLEEKLMEDVEYGYLDYLKFAIRPIYHLFGKSTKNATGEICSESVNNDLIQNGWLSPFPKDKEPPSPGDLLDHFWSLGCVKTT